MHEPIIGGTSPSTVKGVERAVGIAKEGIYTNWLAFEQHCQCRIALESPLLGYLVGYVYRTFDVFCDQKRSGTPLERLRDSRYES